MRGTASDRLFKKIVFKATGLAVIDWNGDIIHDLGQNMTFDTVLDLNYSYLPRVIPGCASWCAPGEVNWACLWTTRLGL